MTRVPCPGLLSMTSDPPTERALARRLASPRCSATQRGAGIEAATVVADLEHGVLTIAAEADDDRRCVRVAYRVADRFSRGLEQLHGRSGPHVESVVELDVDVADATTAGIGGHSRQPLHEVAGLERLGAKPRDEVPDVPDRDVERVDRPLDPRLRLVAILDDQLGHVLERQARPRRGSG